MGIDPVPVGFSSHPEPGPILRSQFVQDLRQAIFKFGPRGIDGGLIQPITFVGKTVERLKAKAAKRAAKAG